MYNVLPRSYMMLLFDEKAKDFNELMRKYRVRFLIRAYVFSILKSKKKKIIISQNEFTNHD